MPVHLLIHLNGYTVLVHTVSTGIRVRKVTVVPVLYYSTVYCDTVRAVFVLVFVRTVYCTVYCSDGAAEGEKKKMYVRTVI